MIPLVEEADYRGQNRRAESVPGQLERQQELGCVPKTLTFAIVGALSTPV